MGRPKGSKNKPKIAVSEPISVQATETTTTVSDTPKRKGRPPGSKNTKDVAPTLIRKVQKRGKIQIITVEEDQKTSLEVNERLNEQENYVNPFAGVSHTFECEFEPMYEWANIVPPKDDEKQKFGSYSASRFPVVSARPIYPVVARINVNVEKLRAEGHSDKEIYTGCISYISKNQSKNKLKRLGDLMPYYFKVKDNNRMSVIFFTNEKKSKMFFGEGE
jgi:hypothetical protein